jgi:hypothetical protein
MRALRSTIIIYHCILLTAVSPSGGRAGVEAIGGRKMDPYIRPARNFRGRDGVILKLGPADLAPEDRAGPDHPSCAARAQVRFDNFVE